jgi:hypothetical protein
VENPGGKYLVVWEVDVFLALEEDLSEGDGDEEKHGDEKEASSDDSKGFRAGNTQNQQGKKWI